MLLTIVIITYNRPAFIRRNLFFLSQFKSRFPITILDGSNPNNQAINQETIKEFPQLFITHKCYPESLNGSFRIQKGFEDIQTKYSVLLADDDFLLPDALPSCLDFLERNEDYSSCVGRIPCLFVRTGPFCSTLIGVFDFLGGFYSISFDSAKKRLLANDVLTPVGHPPLFYSVKRTSIIKEAFGFAHQETQYSAMERIFNGFTLIRGKHKVLNIPFGMRDYSSPPIIDQFRDGTGTENKYIGSRSKAEIYEYLKKNNIAEDLHDFVYPHDDNLNGDPGNIRPLEEIVPDFFLIKKFQYLVNLATNLYISRRFGFSSGAVSALKRALRV
jgi:glycosyltransferase domain-containing protein